MNKRRRHSTADELCRTLLSIDGKPYPAYHDIEKTDYDMGGRFTLCIDHVQSDPFAPPSQCHVRVPLVLAGFPPSTLTPKVREVALRDWLTRRFASAARRAGVDQRTVGEGGWHGRKGGELLVDLPGQHILERSCVVIDRLEGCIEARFTVALPARGRSICGDWAANVLTTTLTELVHEALYYSSSDPAALKAHLDCAEDQQAARAQLAPRGLVAFVADGAMLARRSGASDLPLDTSSAVPFASPPSLRVSLPVPNAKQLVGMGVRRGVTLIVGGGFHGKSTLLEALQLGVYDKVPGDGREGVVTDGAAVKVRAEDGRAVTAVDISPFIDHLPFGKRTTAFATEDASGSTSQAAAIIEALETGASALLMDEDTSATNFLMRDARMQALVAADKEPIKPFITRVRGLWGSLGVSTVLVLGGSGDYFDVADTVLMLDEYQYANVIERGLCADVTERAKEIAASIAGGPPPEALGSGATFARPPRRCLTGASGVVSGAKLSAQRTSLRIGDAPELELAALEQLVEHSQTRCIGEALLYLISGPMDGATPLDALLRTLDETIDREGLDVLRPGRRLGNLARPRMLEVGASLSRLRSLRVAIPSAAPAQGPVDLPVD